jgi:uncharacterized protein YdhG (YjbR/CyaY superfamily)
MESSKSAFSTVDEYIEQQSENVQVILSQIRKVILDAAPSAEEKISYKMPAYYENGPLVYFAAFTNHIGFYSLPSGTTAFQKELGKYKMGKGSIQFPLDQPIPLDLIKKIVLFRLKENIVKASQKVRK